MDDIKDVLESLRIDLERKERRKVLGWEEFLEVTRKEPRRVIRSIFQLFNDMVISYVGNGEDEYPDDPESIGFVKYDCSKIFVEGSNAPFFADRLFANKFVRQVGLLRQGSQQNRIYAYEGSPGCGKSTFLNNLLRSFEAYTATEDGQSFEIFWEIDAEGGKVGVPCPSHDHPILIIPKSYRIDFLDKLLSEGMSEFKHKISHEKEYEWLFERDVCTICESLFGALLEKSGSFGDVLNAIKVRHYKFDRRLGEGVSVFNPGDKPMKEAYLSDKQIQDKLDRIFGSNLVKYVFSPHAKTNNGIYVLMDIKSHNKERFLELHNVISEGVHKVNGIVEERINSLFIALMNPEDKEDIKGEKAESFQERIQYNKIHYVLDVPTEINIYRSIFGDQTDFYFLPRILENFARVIISSRMNIESSSLKAWIPEITKYKKYCDESGFLLRMEIYGGVIPPWLSGEDRKKFTAKVRRSLIVEAENEGEKGFSGRDSVKLFGEFISRYGGKPALINMSNIVDYFKHRIGKEQRNDHIPKNFINSLVGWYNYLVLSEVKESLYFYNKDQISEDILGYIYAANYDVGNKVKCVWTGREIEITVEFFKTIGAYFTGREMSDKDALAHVRDIQKKYTEIVAQDRTVKITETDLYQELFASYVRNLKEKVLQPFLKNENFREAVKSFKTKEFETFDTRLKEHVVYMIRNLTEKFGYTEQGAKEICLYVVDQKLLEKFS